MSRGVLIIVGLFFILLIIFLAWRFVLPQISENENNISNESNNASQEAVSSLFDNIENSNETLFLEGLRVSIDKNSIDMLLDEKSFWIAPIAGQKSQIVIVDDASSYKVGNIVSISGEIKSLKDFKERGSLWKLTTGEIEMLKQNPFVIVSDEINVVN